MLAETLTLLYTSIKAQLTTTFIYHTTTNYMSEANTPLKCHKYGICSNYLTCIYGGSIPIYMPHMKLHPLIISSESLYTDGVTNNDEATAQLHILNWPLGKISQRAHPRLDHFARRCRCHFLNSLKLRSLKSFRS